VQEETFGLDMAAVPLHASAGSLVANSPYQACTQDVSRAQCQEIEQILVRLDIVHASRGWSSEKLDDEAHEGSPASVVRAAYLVEKHEESLSEVRAAYLEENHAENRDRSVHAYRTAVEPSGVESDLGILHASHALYRVYHQCLRAASCQSQLEAFLMHTI
jgi:hypothetical protein